MDVKRLVEMANEIAGYFAFESDQGTAADAVALHLRKYWEPRMRREIVAHLHAGGAGLDPVARAAVTRIGGQV